MITGEWRGYEKECFTIMPNTLLYNMNISHVYQYSNKNISKSIYNISKCITIFFMSVNIDDVFIAEPSAPAHM